MNLRKALKSLWRYITYPFRMGRKGFQEALEDWNYVFRKELKTIFRHLDFPYHCPFGLSFGLYLHL